MVNKETTLWIHTNVAIKSLAKQLGYVQAIEEAGGVVTQDLCTILANPEALGFKTLATNSPKMAFYAPGSNGFSCLVRECGTMHRSCGAGILESVKNDLSKGKGEPLMADTTITNIQYRTIFDSRGVETLEVDVSTAKGIGRVAAPFGAPGSRGEFEAPAYAPGGLGETIKILEKILIPALVGMDALEQEKIDALLTQLDGTPNFEKIGGNTAAVLSTATAKAAADTLKIPMFRLFRKDEGWSLPFPLGKHDRRGSPQPRSGSRYAGTFGRADRSADDQAGG